MEISGHDCMYMIVTQGRLFNEIVNSVVDFCVMLLVGCSVGDWDCSYRMSSGLILI